MMNKERLPHIFTTVSFVVFIVLGLACATTPTTQIELGANYRECYNLHLVTSELLIQLNLEEVLPLYVVILHTISLLHNNWGLHIN
jgi:hypothetical protein